MYDHYLPSAHLAADQTHVIDLGTNKVVATITPAEGIEYVPELKKFYTSNAHDNTIGVVSLKQMKVVKKLKTEAKPDGSTYAAPFHKLYVSDERGKAEAVVDVQKDEIIKTLHFDSETGMPQYDPVARKVYVNLQDQNILAVIDPATTGGGTVSSRRQITAWHLIRTPPRISSRGNELMTVFDLTSTADRILKCLRSRGSSLTPVWPHLVACYSGAIAVFHQTTRTTIASWRFRAARGAHSGGRLRTHRVYRRNRGRRRRRRTHGR
jgi:DNA-binding beta-propeller fold protein YncE